MLYLLKIFHMYVTVKVKKKKKKMLSHEVNQK